MRKTVLTVTLTALLAGAPITSAFADDARPATTVDPGSATDAGFGPAPSDGSGSGVGSTATVVTAGSGSSSSTTTTVTTTTTVPTPDVATQLEALQKAFRDYKAATDATGKRLLLFGLIAIGINILISALKKVAGWSSSTRIKLWIPVIALGLGVVAGALASLAAGQTLVWSLLYGPAASAAAVFLHELLNLVRKPKAPAPATS